MVEFMKRRNRSVAVTLFWKCLISGMHGPWVRWVSVPLRSLSVTLVSDWCSFVLY